MLTSAQRQAKQPVSAVLAGPYGHPLHPIPVTVPIGALAAALVGFLDLRAVPTGTRAFRVGLAHMSLNLVVTLAYAGDFLWRRAAQPAHEAVPAGMLALSAVALALLGISGYLGGKLSYRSGVRVADEDTQAEGYVPGAGRHRPDGDA
ncbi:DUF2231 domain-containing protein [Streptomyces morookaense]|uniref:DUF2231 domain-containing protein n=1 Tax=Streptomyces morookaense TaxID=1970 RepID=A0A7Y7E8M5_STRMO|nr:DUF2231 domain-containing protein [Streptomyces morookaense]NVK80205.1 DUF2231 domain-containing protein [Streptomyces morookaense]GHF40648.1 hypothetical protein GCM10010359_49050 [Streptomyces morookaense]